MVELENSMYGQNRHSWRKKIGELEKRSQIIFWKAAQRDKEIDNMKEN